MDDNMIELLMSEGWTVECENPLEIRHSDGSFATLQAAESLLMDIQIQAEEKRDRENWSRCPTDLGEWYLWRTEEGGTQVCVFVRTDSTVNLFQGLHSIHANNIGGQWKRLKQSLYREVKD